MGGAQSRATIMELEKVLVIIFFDSTSRQLVIVLAIMSTEPAYVVSTLSRYLTLDAPSLRFLHSIQLTTLVSSNLTASTATADATANATTNGSSSESPLLLLLLRFLFQGQLHCASFHLLPPQLHPSWTVAKVELSTPLLVIPTTPNHIRLWIYHLHRGVLSMCCCCSMRAD